MKAEVADHQVKTFGREGQPFFIRRDRSEAICRTGGGGHLGREITLHDAGPAGARFKRRRKLTAPAAEVEDMGEGPVDIVEPLQQPVRHFGE
jgi:hypothetical protein